MYQFDGLIGMLPRMSRLTPPDIAITICFRVMLDAILVVEQLLLVMVKSV